jgi:primase-polymerase (primpol)-like protein
MTVYPLNRTGNTVDVIVENIPHSLKRRPQWVNWRYEERDAKPTKVPYTPEGRKASSTELMTWRSFEKVLESFEDGKHDGVGFVFCSGDPFVGVDLDKCRDPETGDIEEWARNIIDSFKDVVHIEVSPSGEGIHLITRGVFKDGLNTKRVEVYGQDRFFTVTGVLL